MAALNELIGLSAGDLRDRAREEGLKGFSTLDQAGLIIELADEDLGPEVRETVKMSKKDLAGKAKSLGMSGYSGLNKFPLMRKVLDKMGEGAASEKTAAEDAPDVMVRVYHPRRRAIGEKDGPVKGPVIGYCRPEHEAGVYTWLRGHDSPEEAAERSEIAERVMNKIVESVPPGTAVKDPSL